ncbi:MAG: phosphatase PAP2 family protein [Candidatus Aenigmarchaeota archaeon]|nr:phosphatase PAP2 family protein [Candidatus Aenigmarchaeota archaeon]
MEIWYLITLIGTPEFWLVFTGVLIVAYFLVRKRVSLATKNFVKRGLIIFIISLWLTAGVAFALKYVIPLGRPCIPCTENQPDCNPYCMEDHSFPSGHSAVIFCVFTSIFLVFRKRKFLILFVIAIAVALSRYFLGVHYPIDIFAGALIGIAIPIIVLRVFRKRLSFVP